MCVSVGMCVCLSQRCEGQIYAPRTGGMKAISRPGHFLFSLFLWLAGWRWSSLISPEPTGLFLHLHIPSSYCQPRALFHIFFLFKSLAAFQPNLLLPLCKVPYLCLSPASTPLQLRNGNFLSINHSPHPPTPCVVSTQHFFFVFLSPSRTQLILTS